MSDEAFAARVQPRSASAMEAEASFKLAVWFQQARGKDRADVYFARAQQRKHVVMRALARARCSCIDRIHLLSIHLDMSNAARRKRAPRREERVSRTYRLPLSKLRAAKRALGAATVTEAIERALDLAVFQRELVDGTRAMLGIEITPPDAER